MKRLLGLVPNTTVCVAEAEREDYLQAVPPGQLITHPNLPSIAPIRNWINENVQEDCVVMIDDDFHGIVPLIGKQKVMTDPEVIAQVIENAHRIAEDLDTGVFCWSRTRNSLLTQPEMFPMRFVAPISSSFGLRGTARQRKFDVELSGREDLDFTMRTLLEDRILIADMRWHFDHGRIFSGKGGNVGLITREHWERITQAIFDRWGKYVGRSRPRFGKGGGGSTSSMGIRVSRTSPLAKRLEN